MLNKRGQGVTIGTLIMIVLGIVVLVVIILGFTGGFEFIFGKIKLLPGQSLETAAQSCKIAGENKLTVDYCLEFKEVEVGEETQFINCQYPAIQGSIEEKLDCFDRTGQNKISAIVSGENYCKILFRQGKVGGDTRVNDVLCSSKNCTFFDGELKNKTADCPADKKNSISKGFLDSQNVVCCVTP